MVTAALKPPSHTTTFMNRDALNAELEAAHNAHPLASPCQRCFALDRSRSGAEFQMYRCQECVDATRAAQLALWRAQWRILRRHRDAIIVTTRSDRLDVEWLSHRMQQLVVAAKDVAALRVVDTVCA